MTLQDLKYLVALKKHKHFGKAAAACHISQPTLSMQVKKLEQHLGVTLIERTPKNMVITPIGEKIIEKAQQMLVEYNNIIDLAEKEKDPFSGNMSLGIIPTIAPYLLPKTMPSLAKHFPKITWHLLEAQTHVLVEKLISGEIDAAILALPLNNASIEEQLLFKEEFVLAIPATHDLAHKNHILPKQLQHEKIFLLEDGHCMREQSLEFCSMIGAKEHEGFRGTSLETLRYMVASGSGLTLIPRMAIASSASNIRYIPFARPKPQRSIGLCWRKNTSRKTFFLKLKSVLSTTQN